MTNQPTISGTLCETVNAFPRLPALCWQEGTTDRSLTWLETGAAVAEAAQWFDGHADTNLIAAFVLPPSAAAWITEVAAFLSGWSINPIYDTASDEEIQAVLDAVRPAIVFHNDGNADRIAAIAPVHARFSVDDLVIDWLQHARIAAQKTAAEVVDQLRNHAAAGEWKQPASVYCQSSGTTGPSKVIHMSREAAFGAAWDIRDIVGHMHPRVYACLPSGHISHRIVDVFWPIALGGEVHFPSDGADMTSDMQRVKPTVFFAPPLFYEAALGLAKSQCEQSRLGRFLWNRIERSTQRRLSAGLLVRGHAPLAGKIVGRRIARAMGVDHVREFFSGTSTLSAELHAALAQLNWYVRNTYGVSETGGATTVSRADKMFAGEIGQPVPGAEMRLDKNGQLLLRSATLMAGYLENPPIQAGAWWPTGDLLEPMNDTWRHVGRLSNRIPTPVGEQRIETLEAAFGKLYGECQVVIDASTPTALDAYVFTKVVSLTVDLRSIPPSLANVRRVAVILDEPSPELGEIGPTGKLRRWKVAQNRSNQLRTVSSNGQLIP
jgi:long-chain acyl-CoA synthetase